MSEERLKRIETAVARIERGLFGDEELEQWGLVKKVNNHGGRIKRLERWAAGLVVSGATIALVYKIAVELLHP